MSVSHDSAALDAIEDGRASLSSKFLEFCAKVRNNDPSILPEVGEPLRIRHWQTSEKEGIELADALLENTNVTYLNFDAEKYTKRSAEAMAKYVRTSKRLQRICLLRNLMTDEWHHEEMLCCFLPAIQESTSLQKLHMDMPLQSRLSALSFENMLTHTNSLQSLSLRIPPRQIYVAAASSGLKKNTTLRELTLELSRDATGVSPILTSMRDHPLLQRLCLRGSVVDLNGLEIFLLNESSQIMELDIDRSYGGTPLLGLTPVLQALVRRPTLTKMELRNCALGRDEARLLGMALCNIPSLQSLFLTDGTLGSAGLEKLAPALYHNKYIKVLDISRNGLNDMESADIIRDILLNNKTMTAFHLAGNTFGNMPGAFQCIANGLGSNSTLLKIDLSYCALKDAGVSILAQSLGLRNATLQKLNIDNNSITSLGFGMLLGMMEQSNNSITDLSLQHNYIGNEAASLLARSLENNALPNLTSLSLPFCHVRDDGFIELVLALERNTSLLHLDLRDNYAKSERAFLALANSLPEIKVLQRLDLFWCPVLPSAMPLLLAGLRKNTSLFSFKLAGCASYLVPPTPEETARSAGGWMQEMERLGYRNRFHPLIRAPIEMLPPLGVWPHALSQAARLPDVIFAVLRSKPNLVPSEDTGDKEAAEDSGVPTKRKL